MSVDLEEIIVIQHSHTDLGFTHDQPVVRELHRRFLDRAMDIAEANSQAPAGERFCWTVEVSGVLRHWFQYASRESIARLQQLENAGLVEITALPWHFTPLISPTELKESLKWVTRLREDYGFTITSAMNSDVNGQNWPLVDALIDHNITGYSAAINTHFGRAPLSRPNLFLWEGPSGRCIPTLNGPPYGFPGKMGIGHDSVERLETIWLPRLIQRLKENHWPVPVIMLQSVHPFGDNAGPDPKVLEFIKRWNASGKSPRITFGTPRTWWERVSKYSPTLERIRGDWTDFWNFGCLSTARDLAANRRTRVRLGQTDRLVSMLEDHGGKVPPSVGEFRETAWENQLQWQEHTWTADCGAEAPQAEDVAAQSSHKAALAYTARSLSMLMRRDSLIELAAIARAETKEGLEDSILVVNTLPWERTLAGLVAPGVSFPRGQRGDELAGAHFQDRKDDLNPLDMEEVPEMPWKQYPEHALPPVTVPANGWKTIPRSALLSIKHPPTLPDSPTVETPHYQLTFDLNRGGLSSLITRKDSRDWVDPSCPWPLHGWVQQKLVASGKRWPRDDIFQMDWGADTFEIPSGWKPDWNAELTGPDSINQHRVVRSALGTHVIQWLRIKGVDRCLRQEVFLPDYADWIEFSSKWQMQGDPHPQAHYLVFPFSLKEAMPRVDLGGVAMRPGLDQIPGCCHDYFTAQQWVDFSSDKAGVTVALPENPMVQFGGFRFGLAQPEFINGPAWLMGWATANYWHCNFPATQPGWVKTRYRMHFHGTFNPTETDRFASEAAEERPLLHGL